MAETLGVSKSSVSRRFVEQIAKEFERLAERRFDDTELLVIESPYSGVRMRTRRVSRWKNDTMVLRWVASAFPFLAAEKSFRRIQGYRDLCMLKARLGSHISLKTKDKVA
jgi:hypothetical protein